MMSNKSFVIILISIILFVFPFFLTKIIDLIPSEEVKTIIVITMWVIISIFFILEAYGDITKKLFTTTAYILIQIL